MPTYKMTIEYDGTEFVGWQTQHNGRSVQRVIEEALHSITQEDIRIVGAGRTDSGVHARGQVASFTVPLFFELEKLRKSLNALLPDDVVIHSIEEVDAQFHARYSAKARVYEYTIVRKPIAIGRLYAWELFYILNIALLNECATFLVGNHDFRSFCKKDSPMKDYHCTVFSAEWNEEGNYLRFRICANRFLHGMVRALVGTMIDVARGYFTLEEFCSLVDSQQPGTKRMLFAPAKGLCLVEVLY